MAQVTHSSTNPAGFTRERGEALLCYRRWRDAIAGDEALLLARHAPAIVTANRIAGARAAEQSGDVVVMDDGLQNPSLAKDFRIAVADGETGIGNGCCIPAGPLRAPLVRMPRQPAKGRGLSGISLRAALIGCAT